MGWWFGRKSAPPDMRPFVPAWLTTAEAEEGFARSVEGVTAFVRTSSVWATFRSGVWELGILRGTNVTIAGQQVVGGRTAAIPGPSGGSVIDIEARSAVGQILTALRLHGLIET